MWVEKAQDRLNDRLAEGCLKFGGGSWMIWGCMLYKAVAGLMGGCVVIK